MSLGGKCGSCGGELAADARFCPTCGAAVNRFCPRCGAPRAAQARFCPACGTAFDSATPVTPGAMPMAPVYPPMPPAPVARPTRRSLAPVALALAIIIVIAAGALGTGIVKLPGSATGPVNGDLTAPSGAIQSPPPIDSLATPVRGSLTLADSSPVQTIGLDGRAASATVSAAGQPWDGLEIDVPAGAWSDSTLAISARPITGSTFGALVTPISPLYTVSGAEGMASDPVTLTIPATIPADSFAMGFFYDDATGSLEGMPLLAETATSVTVATEHFSSYFVSMIKRALLPETIDSGFRPGKDDWQFTNYGSYVAPGGHCAGQALTEAWYYIERRLKAGAAPLYGLFDNNGGEKTPDRWEDDSDGYRLASVAHGQYMANRLNAANKFFSSWRTAGFDTLEYDAFRYSIAVTAEPQLVSISDAQDKNGHVMLAYRVAPVGVFVADPNFPAAWRLIPFVPSTGKFGQYLSGSTASAIASGNGISYVNFAYKAKTALVDWSALAADWAAFDAGTIGAGAFPSYGLEALAKNADGDDEWRPLQDGYTITDKQLTIRVTPAQNADQVQMGVFRGSSSTLAAPMSDQVTIDLTDGANPLGIYERGAKAGWQNFMYVDFVELTVNVGPAASPGACSGCWVLASTEGGGTFNHDGFQVDSKNGQATAAGTSDFGWTMTGTLSWDVPPATAVPGDVWNYTLTALATCGVGSDALMNAYIVDLRPDSNAPEGQVDDYVLCGAGTHSATGSFTFPDGSHGPLDMTVYAMASGTPQDEMLDTWIYHYEWRP